MSGPHSWWARPAAEGAEAPPVARRPTSSGQVPGRLVLRYHAASDPRMAAEWLAGTQHFAFDRIVLPEVELSATGITFLDTPAVGPGELLLVAFSVPGARDTWRCVARVLGVASWSAAAHALYRVTTQITAFAPRAEAALGQYAEVLAARRA